MTLEQKQMAKYGLVIAKLTTKIDWMIKSGQSLLLNWGEGNNLWECAWIDGKGNRHVAFNQDLDLGLADCIRDYFDNL